MAEYRHGEMDIAQQKKTFGGFLKASFYLCLFAAIVLLFMAIVNS